MELMGKMEMDRVGKNNGIKVKVKKKKKKNFNYLN